MLNQTIENHGTCDLLDTITVIKLKCLCKWTGGDADVIGHITHFGLTDYPIDMVAFPVKAIIGELIAYKRIDDQTAGQTNRKTQHIERGKESITYQIPGNYLYEILKHGVQITPKVTNRCASPAGWLLTAPEGLVVT